jgi:biotin/methionine sulfoxide reductase
MVKRNPRTVQTASHWGVYEVEKDAADGFVSVAGISPDAHPSPLNGGLPEMVRSRLRIDQPYVREGYLRQRGRSRQARGSEPFVPVSWDEALSLVCDELVRVKELHGNQAIYGGCYGWASAGRLHHSPSVLKRFMGLHGGYVDKAGNHSFGAALGVVPHVIGRSDIPDLTPTWKEVVEHTQLVVMFGGAHLKNTQIDPGGAVNHDSLDWFRRARAAGVEIVNVSPSSDDVADIVAPEWIPIRPNTDTALMIGLAGCLVRQNLHDQRFLRQYCVGFEQFERYLSGASDGVVKDARWAAAVTAVPAETIEALARRMASQRTLVTTSWSVQRAEHGEQPVWMTIVLAAMLGGIGLPGQGFGLGFNAISGNVLAHPHDLPRPTLPLGRNPVGLRVPVGRVTDMLLRPGSTLQYNGTEIELPDIKLIYSAGGNPFHHNGNLNRFVEAWRHPDTVIVHEPWWSPVAKFADVVLPATTTMERNDIAATDLSRFWIAMQQVIPPHQQARNDFDIFAELADRLGFGASYHENRTQMEWLEHMYDVAREAAVNNGYAPPPFDEFWAAGRVEFPVDDTVVPLLSEFRADPRGHALNTPSGLIEVSSERIAGFGYDDCPAHPTWLEPSEWLGSTKAARYPFHLLTNQPKHRLHSQLDPAALSKASKVADREPLTMNCDDATDRGIEDGDVVKVFNERGAFLAGVRTTDTITRGVLQIATGAWYDPASPGTVGSIDKHGNPNVVTTDGGSSRLSQAPAAQTVLVNVEVSSTLPKVTAHDWPRLGDRSKEVGT